ncbi:MAG: hypothetical protein FWE18_05255 [Alphaproteobacteria bacterium]|nr:hypothetical protein [Alphaproteobacteria bacterium]
MKEPRTRRSRRSSQNLDSLIGSSGEFDIDSILGEADSDASSLEDVFRRKTNNPFDNSAVFQKAVEENELEELARRDTNIVYATGYSIHLLTPYILTVAAIALGFIITDKYFFNIVEYLSQDIRYKLPAYGILTLALVVFTWFFIKRCFDYINFVMSMTKYKLIYGLKFLKKKNEITLFSVAEALIKRGIFGYILNYGTLIFFTNTRRKYVFDKIHGARYIYEIIQELQHGESRGLEQNETITNILSGGKGNGEFDDKKSQKNDSDTVDFNDLSSLGFSQEELMEFGLLPKAKRQAEENKGPFSDDEDDVKDSAASVEHEVEAESVSHNERSRGSRRSHRESQESSSSSSGARPVRRR